MSNMAESNQGYNIFITGRHIHVTEAMKQYAFDKISKVDRFSTRIIEVKVTMDIQKLDHRVDIVMKVDQIKVKVTATTPDMYASIDRCVERLQTKLRRYKDRLQDHQAKGLAAVEMKVQVVRGGAEETTAINDEIEEETSRRLEDTYGPHSIIKEEKRPLKVLTYDEALMKIQLSGDSFLVFRSEEDMKLRVIYRREDSDYGIIQPE